MAIETIQFDLSMVDPETGLYLTGNVYTIDGVVNEDNSLRHLSIGQLVMAICLRRAAELETQIVEKMEEISNTSTQLEYLTKIETDVIAEFQTNTSAHAWDTTQYTLPSGETYRTFLRSSDIAIFNSNQSYVRNDEEKSNQDMLYDDFVKALEAKMDEKNSFSQQTMIELQSLTNKRDQSYDMISNILKSLNTVLIGNANNM